MANCITGIRILSSLVMLFFRALSQEFYVLYLIAGFSDMIDGTVARKTNSVSEFGSKLDTIADFVFVIVCLIKLVPVLHIPVWAYIWTVIIALIKGSGVLYGYVKYKRFVAVHTLLNKVTGAQLFILPLTISFINLKCSLTIACIVATIAAIHEGYVIRVKENNRPGKAEA